MTLTLRLVCAALLLAPVACNETRGGADVDRDAAADVSADVITTDATDDAPDAPEDVGADAPPPPPDECASDDECVLYDDCCLCRASTSDLSDDPEACADSPPCFQTACGAMSVTQARCLDGRCVLDTAQCGLPACNALPPDCPPERVPSLDATGTCWSGTCVRPSDCATLPCDQCASDDVCWQSQATGEIPRCYPRPAACGDTAACGCIGPEASAACPGGCDDDGGELWCLDGG